MNQVVQATCPYCGAKNLVFKDGFDEQSEVCRCNIELGGCNLDFVVNLSVHINAYSKRIEGEIDKLDGKA